MATTGTKTDYSKQKIKRGESVEPTTSFLKRVGFWDMKIKITDPPPRLDIFEKRIKHSGKMLFLLCIPLIILSFWKEYWLAGLPVVGALSWLLEQYRPIKLSPKDHTEIRHLARDVQEIDQYRQAVIEQGRDFYKQDLSAMEAFLDSAAAKANISLARVEAPLFKNEEVGASDKAK